MKSELVRPVLDVNARLVIGLQEAKILHTLTGYDLTAVIRAHVTQQYSEKQLDDLFKSMNTVLGPIVQAAARAERAFDNET